MLTTNQKGALAETAIALEAIKLGIGVYRPYADGRYDLIFDLVSNHGFSALRRVLAPGGMILAGSGPGFEGLGAGRWAVRQIGGLLASRFSDAKMALLAARLGEDLAVLAAMMATGKVTPVIESCYNLYEAAAAIREVARGHARGKVVVLVGGET